MVLKTCDKQYPCVADMLMGLPIGCRELAGWPRFATASQAEPKLPQRTLIPTAYNTLEKWSLTEVVKLSKKIKCQIILGRKDENYNWDSKNKNRTKQKPTNSMHTTGRPLH